MSSSSRGRRIVVVRHAETVHNVANIWQGHADSELSERGRRQVEEAAPHLAAYEPDLLVSSDLQRAAATAEALSRLSGLTVRHDERLREVNVGEWTGLHADEVEARYPELLAAMRRGEDVPKGVTGETRADVARRVRDALGDVEAELAAGQTAVVVTHGGAGRVAVAGLVGMPLQESDRFLRGLGNCHWAELGEVASRGSGGSTRWRISGWNLGPWRSGPL